MKNIHIHKRKNSTTGFFPLLCESLGPCIKTQRHTRFIHTFINIEFVLVFHVQLHVVQRRVFVDNYCFTSYIREIGEVATISVKRQVMVIFFKQQSTTKRHRHFSVTSHTLYIHPHVHYTSVIQHMKVYCSCYRKGTTTLVGAHTLQLAKQQMNITAIISTAALYQTVSLYCMTDTHTHTHTHSVSVLYR